MNSRSVYFPPKKIYLIPTFVRELAGIFKMSRF